MRADEQTIPRFEAEGSKPFQYQTRARTVTVLSYWQLPERLYRRSGRTGGVGEGGTGGRPARRAEQAAEARKTPTGRQEEGGSQEEGCRKEETTARVVPAKRASRAQSRNRIDTALIVEQVSAHVPEEDTGVWHPERRLDDT